MLATTSIEHAVEDGRQQKLEETSPLYYDTALGETRLKPPPRWPLVLSCLVTVSLVPVLAKRAMTFDQVPPLILATVQLVLSAIIICFVAQIVLLHLAEPITGAYWKDVTPVGACFGLKLAIMNLGLAQSSTVSHVALASTEVLWAAACATCLTPDDALFSMLGKIALAGCAIGAFFTAMGEETFSNTHKSGYSHPQLALAANLAGPALQGLVVALLRAGVLQAAHRSHSTSRAKPPLPSNTLKEQLFFVLDFTAKKVFISAIVAAGLAIPVELFLDAEEPLRRFEQLRILFSLPTALASLAVAATQLSFTALAVVVSAPSIGVIGAVKCIPQVFVAVLVSCIISKTPTFVNSIQLIGVAILLASALLWTHRGQP